jgi:hypothetical protein
MKYLRISVPPLKNPPMKKLNERDIESNKRKNFIRKLQSLKVSSDMINIIIERFDEQTARYAIKYYDMQKEDMEIGKFVIERCEQIYKKRREKGRSV